MAELSFEPVQIETYLATDRTLPSGDEAGTAPGDRPFRPDVEGLRAVAVLLVVLFHSGVSWVSGGYVGVDVFFVISGFVITGVLLRERTSTGRTSILAFYGRRARRIIPAATLVIIATVILAYWFLGIGGGAPAATDARWAAVFLANFHFISTGTNYLSSQQPPSPLQNFWSLAVEEQFYLVYPTIFLVVAGLKRLTLRARLALVLTVVIVVSFAYSVSNTHADPVNAYFSPFTRAWELALGALVAVCTPRLLRIPAQIAASATWVGLGAILVGACAFTGQTAYPGSLVAIPVVGAALVIAGGMNAHAAGAEALLNLAPFRWLGQRSYSLYLWHWPILIIAAEYAGKTTLPVKDNLGWDLVALAAAMLTYRLVENPIRHAPVFRRIRWASIGLGVGLVALTFASVAVVSAIGNSSVGTNGRVAALAQGPSVSLRTVKAAVAASRHIEKLPSNLDPPLQTFIANPGKFLGHPTGTRGKACASDPSQYTVGECAFGDPKASRTIVLLGDSHAAMWFQALNGIAIRKHWKLVLLYKDGCPASLVPVERQGVVNERCNQWHKFVVGRIRSIDPEVLIVSQAELYVRPDGSRYYPSQWQRSLDTTLAMLSTQNTKKTIVLGNLVASGSSGPDCLGRHTDNVQTCSSHPRLNFVALNKAEKRAAKAVGAKYVNVVPWFCTSVCSEVIGNDEVYWQNHVTVGYSLFLEGVLQKAIALPKK